MVRFTIRDLFWLAIIGGLALGWLVDHRAASARYAKDTELLVRKELLLQDIADRLEAPAEDFSLEDSREYLRKYLAQDADATAERL